MSNAEKILHALRTWHRMPAGELLQEAGISRASLMRAMQELGDDVLSRGRARRTSYAARRQIRGIGGAIPLYRVDQAGRGHEAALLEPIYPQGCALQYTEKFAWPLEGEMADGWFQGLPYPVDDMRPQGFLGRNFAHRYAPLLQLGEDLQTWNEDDVLHALSLLGWDQSGDYILGDAAFRRFLEQQQKGRHFLSDAEIEKEYPERARQALHFGVAESSAAGEFPKFTAHRTRNAQSTHVIVKFSGADASPQEQRWADLLVCEHLALNTVAESLNIPAAHSRIYRIGGRTFYEVDRFDRHGEFGRSGICSWASMNAALFGLAGPWSGGADALLRRRMITPETHAQIHRLWHFGRLIANTDMHDGNLSFLPDLRLTPAYDMLPMMYAPQRGVELVERAYIPSLPLPGERLNWLPAAEAALAFWRRAADDRRISGGFQKICAENAAKLEGTLIVQRD